MFAVETLGSAECPMTLPPELPPRAGRPARVPGAKIRKVTLTMTEEEWETLREAASLNGQSRSDYMRISALGDALEDLEMRQMTLRMGDRRQRVLPVEEDRRKGPRRGDE